MPRHLYTFGLSHYCEKARWALDWHGVEFEERPWPPGVHVMLARRAGARTSTVPILRAGGEVIQGSAEIVDWAEANASGVRPALKPIADSDDAHELESRADETLGPAVRRHFYARMLPQHRGLVKGSFFSGTALSHRFVGQLMWPVTTRLIAKMYDAGPGAAQDSRAKMQEELDRLDDRLTDGRPYLVGDRFSRVDLTLASLLAIFARPHGSSRFRDLPLSPALADDVSEWSQRPAIAWVRATYRNCR